MAYTVVYPLKQHFLRCVEIDEVDEDVVIVVRSDADHVAVLALKR